MADLDTLRPEVADAVSALDETTCMTNPGLKWYATIRAELLRLAGEVTELRALCAATYQAAGCYGLPERFKDALSNAATGERIHDVDVDNLCPVDPVEWVERAEKAEAELAALKARIAEAPVVVCQKTLVHAGNTMQTEFLEYPHGRMPGGCNSWAGKRVRLVVEE